MQMATKHNFMWKKIIYHLNEPIPAAPLATLRLCFGLLMAISLVRFVANGWVQKLYLDPQYHFSYHGFEWVKPLGPYTYLLFLIAFIAALLIAIGWFYRSAVILFFLSFTYIELMDKTTYLNHYYFVSMLSLLLIFIPANGFFSVDSHRSASKRWAKVPRWSILSVQLLLATVYFYAGLAKLNSDWLFRAMPLSIWLTAKYDLPIIGYWLQQEWVHYGFSWAGALYDLTIPIFLWWRPTRQFAFLAVIGFHVLTGWLFPIGMFPYIMIGCALVFFDAPFHQRLINRLSRLFKLPSLSINPSATFRFATPTRRWLTGSILSCFFLIQLMVPLRYLAYPGELFWTEQGYRLSWRVMLMEKAGYAQFKVLDPNTGRQFYVQNEHFLTPFQEKQMATQPDFILEYAQILAQYYQEAEGIHQPQVYVESFVALNGRPSRPYIDPTVDLTKIKDLGHRSWVLPFNDQIYGF